MILSASRRTDIPCYYTPWFINRIRAGYALMRNPMNHAQLSKVPLGPDVVDCIVFWTKDARNMLPYLDELDRLGYNYYFQFTLTPYGREIEPGLRPKCEIEDTFISLSNRIGSNRLVWRYDPVIFNGTFDVHYHKEQFERMCGKLAPYTDTVIFSFADLYSKLRTPLIRAATAEEIDEFSAFVGKMTHTYGIRAETCCEAVDLTAYGIGQAHCIDPKRIESICGSPLEVHADKNQRPGCGCCESIDIGAYNTCMNGCIYCYANNSAAVAEKNWRTHDPKSELLIGGVSEHEKITERKVRSQRAQNIVSHRQRGH